MNQSSGEIVDEILSVACLVGASDIHFNPVSDEFSVLFRLHGRLLQASEAEPSLPQTVSKAAVQRLKVLAKLNLGEQRKPQDGQLVMKLADGTCDLRINVMPTVQGERLAARITSRHALSDSIASLGMTEQQQEQVQTVLHEQSGLIVVAGKIGSGKSTTMHAMLRQKSKEGASVLSIEDPVERYEDSFAQIQVDERQGFTFAACLRSALRQDPDVLMVGEIRDEITAAIAVRAGMIGHLIMTSLHADHPALVISRLLDFGIRPHFIETALRLIIWQRLRPIYCESCGGKGCSKCHQLGVLGRQAEFQVMTKQALQTLFFGMQMHAESVPTGGRDEGFGPIYGEAETTRYGVFSERFERPFTSRN